MQVGGKVVWKGEEERGERETHTRRELSLGRNVQKITREKYSLAYVEGMNLCLSPTMSLAPDSSRSSVIHCTQNKPRKLGFSTHP